MPPSPEGQDLQQRIARHVEGASHHSRSFLINLAKIPKPRMQEHAAVRLAAETLSRAGWETEVFAGLGLGEPIPDGAPINLFARRRGHGEGRSLLLEAHLDVVPVGRRDRWTRDPWGGEIVDDLLYARGVHDDVAGAALVCLAGVMLSEIPLRTAGEVCVLITTEEESSGGGMRALLQRHPEIRIDAHLLVDGNGEPHECIVGHPGSISLTISIPGPYGSAQSPAHLHDANPVEFAAQLMDALRQLEQRLAARLRPDFEGLPWPKPSVAFVGIKSDGWISNVPERCDLQIWANVIPPMTFAEFRSEVEACVQSQAASAAWFKRNLPTIAWGPLEVPALTTSMRSQFYEALASAHRASFGTELVPRLIGGWGDTGLLGCPNALFYGPGGGGNCHSYDEFYRLGDLDPMLRSLLYLVTDWCGVAPPTKTPARGE